MSSVGTRTPRYRAGMVEPARLRPMTASEYDAWEQAAIAEYAVELAESGGVDAATAAVSAWEQHRDLLPDGEATVGMVLRHVLDDHGEAVGVLWLGPHPRRAGAGFVYDVEIDEARRGGGLGRRAMLAAEALALEQGWDALGLNVFGPNARARRLYDSLGYGVVSTTMLKRFDAAPPEERLAGGNMTEVVRVGDVVLRGAGPWTPTVHRLLTHLLERGFDAAPRPIGVRSDGREALTFLPGTVPVYPLPEWVWFRRVLVDAGRMLRRWHEASLGFPAEGAVWQLPAHEPVEVVCHNDFSPHNLVFDDGRLTGVIDVDTASPGPRVWDLAHLATRLVPLSRDHPAWSEPAEAAARLEVLLDAYGWDRGADPVLRTAGERLLDLAAFSDSKAVELDRPDLHDHARLYREDAAWLETDLAPRLLAHRTP